MDLLYSISTKVGEERARVLEEHIKLHIQPKPKWLPQFIWHKILRRLLVYELLTK